MERFFDTPLAKIIEHANALILVVDPERRVEFLNHALAELLGRTAAEVLGTDLLRWVPPAEHVACERCFQRSQLEPVTGFDLGLVSAGGAVVRGVFNVAALSDAEQRVDWIVAIGQDSTALKILEHQVIQAEKLATLGQLTAGIVHEINNPLTSITVYADFLAKKLRRDTGDPADIAMLDKILDGSNRILKCVRDLVSYAKPSTGRLDVLSLNEVVERSVSFCEHVLEKSRGRLQKVLAYELPPIYGVQDQLQQVLINLVTNAAQALPAPGGTITIRTAMVGASAVVIEVEDSGCGISEPNMEQLFVPFFTTKPAGEGTGLGLSIVKKIVDHHEGSIIVRSTPGQGTTMSITLPTKQRGR